ncbi:MotA/TolQ/ExbB proton channel family protein [Pelagibius sp. Alg239-R121]|uniref:MotA/TolQ/ExbB proton channel family protein n=1 Tax=Pelagibius sp. Alg239-R121 TaxID=2993448 RepID=UPI0024A7390B|nr:MotA/TolQ/ExbB proton channel family protein [Pelagibius sp. Alg239-R121]
MMETFSHWLEAGGPIVIILGVLSIYSLALVVLKLIQFRGALSGRADRESALAAWRSGSPVEARKLLLDSANPVNEVVVAAMEGMITRWDAAVLREEVERIANERLEILGRHLRTLEVLAVVSPLLGLLGTVLGMIASFQQLELAGGSANAAVLAAGIWQALLTTAMGLIVAIPAAIAANLLGARLDRVGHVIEDCVTRLFVADHSRDDHSRDDHSREDGRNDRSGED